jgi:hypothetical protein
MIYFDLQDDFECTKINWSFMCFIYCLYLNVWNIGWWSCRWLPGRVGAWYVWLYAYCLDVVISFSFIFIFICALLVLILGRMVLSFLVALGAWLVCIRTVQDHLVYTICGVVLLLVFFVWLSSTWLGKHIVTPFTEGG